VFYSESVVTKNVMMPQMRLFHQQCREVNLIVTTAMIPGKPALKLLTKEMVDDMKPGDMARSS
jgi:NAD(P) transhydrogenase